MRKWLFILMISLMPCMVFSQVHVKGYYKSNGTYVQPHMRSNPDGNQYNNWSTKGNVNPYTGKEGTKNVDNSNNSTTNTNNSTNVNNSNTSYSNNRIIETGPRGGKYYINSNGNKTYVRRR
jgi:hypothetical protein